MRRFFGAMLAAGAIGVALLGPTGAARAWGPEGHRVVALIADRLLQQSDPGARAKVQALLATDKGNRLTKNDIAAEATWADVLREKSPEARTATAAWHAVPLKPDNPDASAACFGHKPLPAGYPASHGPLDNCVIDKLAQFEAELKNPETSPHERLAALQFVLNLAGDISDPLNTIDRGDQGGHCTALQLGAKPPVRLSTYWEEILVREVAGSDAAKGAARLAAAIPAAEAKQWAEGNAEAWARDSYEVAKGVVYGFAAEPAGKHEFPSHKGQPAGGCASAPVYRVEADYETKALAAVKTQLAKGGVRLARILRDSFK